jgi:hypothetical protein
MATGHQLGGPLAIRQYTTYLERYSDPQNDPSAGNYEDIMKEFACTPKQVRTKGQYVGLATLLFATASVQPHDFLHLAVERKVGIINCLHTPITMVKPFGTGTMHTDYLLLAGDQRGNASPLMTVYIPDEAFKIVNLRVPIQAHIEAVFAADSVIQQMERFSDTSPTTESEEISISHMMYLPPKYAVITLTHGTFPHARPGKPLGLPFSKKESPLCPT